MKKILCIALIICLGLLVLAGCSTGSNAGASTPAAPPASTDSSAGDSGGGTVTDDWDGLELKIVTNYPAGTANMYILDYWIEKVGELSDGKITATVYAGETLMKNTDQLPGVLEGTADMVLTDPAYNPEYFPLLGGFFLPGLILDNSSVATYVASDYITNSDFEELKQLKMMFALGLTPPGFVSNKPYTKLEDFKGSQIRANGFAVDTVNQLGATAVAMTSAEVYEAMLKGTVDATLMGLDSLLTFNLAEVSKYVVRAPGTINIFHYFGMNNDTWNKIPKEYQDKILELNQECIATQAPRWDGVVEQGLALSKENGGELSQISDAEMARILETLAPVRDKWLEKMDAQGLDGQAALDKLQELADKYNAEYGNQ